MLVTITTTHHPATDLGFLLHKNPARVHSSKLSFGMVYAFYPEATAKRCTAALMLEVDPVELSRGRGNRRGLPLQPYVNDRPYAASSFLSVAIADLFRTADQPQRAAAGVGNRGVESQRRAPGSRPRLRSTT